MWIRRQLRQRLARGVQASLEKAAEGGCLDIDEVPDIRVEIPRDRSHGDFATNAALALAGEVGMPPREIAELIVDNFDVDRLEYDAALEVAGPGFINFKLSSQWLRDVVREALANPQSYGNSQVGADSGVLVEFVSANPTGPLVVANARAAAVGDTLCRLLEAAGYRPSAEYYINDAGNQVLNLGKAMEVRCWQQFGEDRDLPPEAYPGEYVTAIAAEFISEHGEQQTRAVLTDQEAEERQRVLGSYAVEHILKWQQEALRRYGVEFDRWVSEQSIRDEKGPERILELLGERGYTYEKDGAVWLRSTAFDDDKDRVLVKSDGEYTYLVPDIAYHLDKLERGHETLIDLLGPDHHGYVPRMKAALQALGYGAEQLQVLIVQWVRLLREGQVVKMSKRGGEFIPMEELLDEVGRDAARFFFLMRSPETPMDFDLDLAKLETNENPVYYVQYAHARICSLLDRAAAEGVELGCPEQPIDCSFLSHDKEEELMRRFAEFPHEVAEAAKNLEPQRITAYCRELATTFHAFYTECRVLGEEPQLTQARLALCRVTQQLLRRALKLLGVSAPRQM